MKKLSRFLLIVIVSISTLGCASTRHALPINSLKNARISGFQNIRAFSGISSNYFKEDFLTILEQDQKRGLFSYFDINFRADYSMLAISGGAGNGAYGVGLLNGWSREGSRPVFKIVTGISTGAIIAPFAFLGSKYDDKLELFYTEYSTKDIMRKKVFLEGFFSNSFASINPLKKLIDFYFDVDLLKKIAEEYSKGRRLYVGTTNLDAQRLVIWDMGRIASMGNDKALKLFRKIILASASIPIVFPPVYFDAELDDETYDEMHVDGGVTKQVFFLYDVLQGFDEAFKGKGIEAAKIKYKIYIIRNGYAEPIFKEIPDKLSAIAERTIDTMTNAQAAGDLYQLYTFTKINKGDFNLAYIPKDGAVSPKEFFDPVEMQRLFDLGYKEALRGYPWRKTPPGLDAK